MRLILITAAMLPGAATAHPGHLAEVAGHGHWLGAAAIGAAIAIGLWSRARARKDAEADTASEDETEEETQEA